MAHNVANCLNDFESAVSAGDQDAAYAALFEALHAATAAHKGKAAPVGAAPDADVLAAVDSAKAAVQAVNTDTPAVEETPAGANPAVGGLRDELWSLFVTELAPKVLDWLKKRLGG